MNDILKQKNKNNNKYLALIILFVLMSISFYMYIARGQYIYNEERALYYDDMMEYSVMTNKDTNIFQKLTDTWGNKNRYVSNLMFFLFWKIIGNNFDVINSVILLSNIIMMMFIWYSIYSCLETNKRTIKILITVGGTIFLVSSRFLYYSFQEIYGLLENLATVFTIIFIVLLWKDNFTFSRKFWFCHLVYVAAVYTHERYAVLAGVIFIYCILSLFYNKNGIKNWKIIFKILPSISIFFLILLIRIVIFKSRFLVGTEGTDAISGFDILTFFKMLSKSFLYLIGINYSVDDTYLNGIAAFNVSIWVYIFTVFCWVFIFFVFYYLIKTKNRIILIKYLFCIISIVFLAVISSVTIRVEMRWMYAPLVIECFIICHALSLVIETFPRKANYMFLSGCFALLLSLMIENYYFQHWKNIHNWESRVDASCISKRLNNYLNINKLYIISKRVETLNKDYIQDYISNIEKIAKTKGKTVKNILILDDIKKIDTIDQKDVVLFRYDEKWDYIDISKSFYNISYQAGHYDDGWSEPYTKFVCMVKDKKTLKMSFYLPPFEMDGNGETTILLNGQVERHVNYFIPGSYQEIEINNLEEGENIIELISDFSIVKNSNRFKDGRACFTMNAELIQRKDISYQAGHYDDGWSEPYTKFVCMVKDKKTLKMSFYLPPFEMDGNGETTILLNGQVERHVNFIPGSYQEIEISNLKEGDNIIELISDFSIVKNSNRSRDGRLCFTMNAELIPKKK